MPNYCTYPQALELFQKVDETKQNTLIAGTGINIAPDNTISATGGGGGSYTAGDGIKITGDTIALDLGLLTGSNLTKAVPGATIKDALDQKQGTLTFDDAPTQNSSNPVKSGGVYSALSGKQNTLTFDNVPTNGSNNPVKSGGIYDALAPKVSETLLNDTVGWVGKNMLPIKIDDVKANNTGGTWSGNTYTQNNTTFECSVDANGYVTSVKVNGTPSSSFDFSLMQKTQLSYLLDDVGESVTISGAPSGASDSTYRLGGISLNGTDGAQIPSYEEGATFTIGDYSSFINDAYVVIRVYSGASITDKVFKPMLRDASITDDTYYPPHKSVEEEIAELTDVLSENSYTDATVGFKIVKWGKVCTLSFEEANSVTAEANERIGAVLPTTFRPKIKVGFGDSNGNKRMLVSTGGSVTCGVTLNNTTLRGSITYVTN